ncbi:hypothetical protein [Burkholderia sp. Ax-1724]|uniref:hypothetical protein n=1 Tax=Burkholderia sp. Ax-1724 TaxID=2608336 RepID=UPI001423FEE9|nr:hypothetical protein [Burkholderia sp. Ax-1724]NIF54010.1 hypothetical protein [Burkholderia sp. Ax-1724]
MDTLKQYEFFHDWYLIGISADMDARIMELLLILDDIAQQARVIFQGASRCLVNDFLIQNIVYDAKILRDHDSTEYKQALESLEKSYFGKAYYQPKPIAVFSATLGADLLVEFDSFEIKPVSPMAVTAA